MGQSDCGGPTNTELERKKSPYIEGCFISKAWLNKKKMLHYTCQCIVYVFDQVNWTVDQLNGTKHFFMGTIGQVHVKNVWILISSTNRPNL